MNADLILVGDQQIKLSVGHLHASVLLDAALEANSRLVASQYGRIPSLDIFDIIDMRMLSGMIGELFATVLAEFDARLYRNPNIDGYPDLCDITSYRGQFAVADFLHFGGGGIEVKNTFGYKRPGVELAPRARRIGGVLKPVWKAHHQETNSLLALQSDYINGVPQIVAGYFADNLTPNDWSVKAEPRPGSTMTAFSQTKASGWQKLRAGAVFAAPDHEFL